MIVRFENLLSKQSTNKNYSHNQIELLKSRKLWSLDNVIYWVNKVIKLDSHYNVLINPLYAWEKIIENGDWSIFDTVAGDEVYKKKLTDRLCLRHEKAEPGVSDNSGNALYMKAYKFDVMPVIKRGDCFVFDNASYIAKSFEVHRRIHGPKIMERVIVVTHEASSIANWSEEQISIVSNDYIFNPIKRFTGELL